jgi:hypothetical protein
MLQIDLVQKSLCEDSYFEFFRLFWSAIDTRPLQINWTHEFIANIWQEAGLRVVNRQPKDKDQMLNMSPGQSKTRLCTELFIPWLLSKNPGLKIIVGSFSLDTSNKFSSEIRKVMESPLYKKYWPESGLQKDNNRVSRFYTIANGSVETVSPGSATTTKHADAIFLDDISSASQAESVTMNEGVKTWYDGSLKSRVTSITETCFFIIGQRYHNQDVFSYLLEQQEYNQIVLPAILDEAIIIPSIETIRDIYPQAYALGTMDAMRMPMDAIEKLKESPVFDSQYQQDAPDMATVIFKREYVPEIDEAEIRSATRAKTRHCVIDSAGSAKAGSDESAIGIFFNYNGCLYLEASYFVKYEFVKLERYIMDILGKAGIGVKSKVLIESAGPTGTALIGSLKEKGFNAIGISHEGKSKLQRMKADEVAIPVEAKRFIVVKHQNSKKFIDQFCGPLKLRRDDGRDMGTYAIRHLLESGKGDGKINLSILGNNGEVFRIVNSEGQIEQPKWRQKDLGIFI